MMRRRLSCEDRFPTKRQDLINNCDTDAIEHRVGLTQRQQQEIDQRISDADGVVGRQFVRFVERGVHEVVGDAASTGTRGELARQHLRRAEAAFVKQFAQQLGKPEPDISPEAFQKLLDYSWPGNVRELQNAIEYAVVLARQSMIDVKELPAEIQLPTALQQTEIAALPRSGVQSLDDVERTAIIQALAECHGNKKKAAELLGIQRPTLYNKMKRYAIEL